MDILNSEKPCTHSRVVTAHQPNFMPWAGYFYKMVYSDYFIILDEVQFTKGGYTNRVKIRQGDKTTWLTVPVSVPGLHASIKDVNISTATFARKHINTLRQTYARTPYLTPVLKIVSDAYDADYERLLDLNIHLLNSIVEYTGIECQFVMQSDLITEGHSNEMLASLASQLSATVYVAGQGARAYTEGHEYLYHNRGLDVAYHDFSMPEYEQVQGKFVGGCSMIDALFNLGPNAGQILELQRHPPFVSSKTLKAA